MKLSDYISEKIVELGVRHVFMVTGGGAMHLNQSFGQNENINCIFNHHEQACAMGAEAYFRVNNKIALVNVTSGPGATNTITGVYGAFVDSIAMMVISGQVKYETTVRSTGMPLRQYGDQEIDIEPIIKPITKYSCMITDPKTIRYHLEKAFYIAVSGRPGPVWLDIPLDIQGAQIDPLELIGFDSEAESSEVRLPQFKQDYSLEILDKIKKSSRPVIFAGNGIRLSGQYNNFLALIEKLGIPVVTGWNAHDAAHNQVSEFVGRPGTIGDRPGNFAVQNADLLLILGSRLNIRQVSYNWSAFARDAYKIWIDIDELELKKPSVQPDFPIAADLREVIPSLLSTEYSGPSQAHREWLAWCKERQQRYPVVLSDYEQAAEVNPYFFMKKLFDILPADQIVVTGNGSACVVSFQSAYLKPGQRLWTNSGCASMGYDLPAAIGACKAAGDKPVVCIAGDGSIMMNLQELETIAGNKLPIKIIILNNNGYSSIFQTHRNFFNGVEIGAGPKSGVSFPNFSKIASAFDMFYVNCDSHESIERSLNIFLAAEGPSICEVFIDENQQFSPKLSSKQLEDGRIVSPPLEDLFPFLSREELADNMIIEMQKF